jgi:hypothetical protein
METSRQWRPTTASAFPRRSGDGPTRSARVQAATRLAAAALVTMLGLVLGPGLPAATAVPITGAITSVTVTPADPLPGEDLRLDLTWAVPDSAEHGDTFTMDLPDELRRITGEFTLTDDDGTVVATAVVAPGLVTFTLTEYVDTHDNVHGSAFFWVRLDHETAAGERVLDFGEVSTTITVQDPEGLGGSGEVVFIDRTHASKRGFWWDEEANQWDVEGDNLRYWIEAPVGPFDMVTFRDTLGGGQQNICVGNRKPKVLFQKVDASGKYKDGPTDAPLADVSVTCTDTTLLVTVKNVPELVLATLDYQVRVVEMGLESYSNSAYVTARTTELTQTTVVRTGAGGTGTGNKPTLAVTKSSDPAPGTTVTAGQTLTYTLTFDHGGSGPASVDYTDHLDDVLDDATFGSILSTGGLNVTVEDGNLRIQGSITADTTVVYTVVVKASGRGDNELRNVLAPGTGVPGPDDPQTTHAVRYLYVQKLGDGSPRDGAAFVLRADADGRPGAELSTPALTPVPGEVGLYVTDAIEPGTYWLEEQRAPDGFELLAAPVRFRVADDGTVELTDPSASTQVTVSADLREMSTISVTDVRSYALPLTGGTGAAIFWSAGGVLLVVGAAGLFLRRRPATTAAARPAKEAA